MEVLAAAAADFVLLLLHCSSAVAAGVDGKPVSAAAEAGEGMAVGRGDKISREVGLGRSWESGAERMVMRALRVLGALAGVFCRNAVSLRLDQFWPVHS